GGGAVVRRDHDDLVAAVGQRPRQRLHAPLRPARSEGRIVLVEQADPQGSLRATAWKPVLSAGWRTAASRFQRLSRAYAPRDSPPREGVRRAQGEWERTGITGSARRPPVLGSARNSSAVYSIL